MMLRRAVFFTALASGLLVACQLILGIEDDRFSFTADGGAASDANTEAGPVDLCQHAFPPGPPSVADTADRETIAFAMNRATIRSTDESGTPIGYDLDNGCTCNPSDLQRGARSCVPPDASDPLCDGDGGIDNAVGAIVDRIVSIAGASGFAGEPTRQAICGAQSMLVVLSNYNGLADDPDVAVRFVPSFGIREGDRANQGVVDADCPVQDQATGYPLRPHGDVRDKWSTPNPLDTYDRQSGWVSNFTLVVDGRRTAQALFATLGSNTLKLESTAFAGRIVPLDTAGRELPIVDGRIQSASGFAERYRLDNVTLAGRAKSDDILSAIGHTRAAGIGNDGGSPYFCRNAALSLLAQSFVCSASDSVIPARQDFTDLPCNALSVVFRFSANQASVGDASYTPLGDECDPSYRGTCDGGPN